MRCGFILSLATLACVHPAMPQASPARDEQVSAFIETARAASEKYRDRSVAIADGYRKIGTDFPGMGEHWINIGLLFDGKFEAAHPEVLTYVVVSGRPRLLGVAYILPLLKGEAPPDWPVAKEKWHDHYRTIEDETELPRHQLAGHDHAMDMGAMSNANDEPRMAMLHAWLWLDNPDGIFAADNWALPWYRLGIPAPSHAPDTAAKALALATGASEYFTASIGASVSLTPAWQKKIDAAFARSRATVDTLLKRDGFAATPDGVNDLSSAWTELWKNIDASADSKNRPALQHVPIR